MKRGNPDLPGKTYLSPNTCKSDIIFPRSYHLHDVCSALSTLRTVLRVQVFATGMNEFEGVGGVGELREGVYDAVAGGCGWHVDGGLGGSCSCRFTNVRVDMI